MEEKEVEKQHKENTSQASSVNKYLWIAGAVLLVVFGWFGLKMVNSSFEDYKVSLVAAPADAPAAGSVVTFTWRVDGPPTTINHTAVYLGQTSTPGELGTDVHPQDTKYDLVLKDFDYGKYGIPLQFIGNIKLEKPGKYYYRIQATVKEKNYWSEEYTLEVK